MYANLRRFPQLHWVYKVGIKDKVVSDVYFYIDDGRLNASSVKIKLEINSAGLPDALFLGTARCTQEKNCAKLRTWGVARNFCRFDEGCCHSVCVG